MGNIFEAALDFTLENYDNALRELAEGDKGAIMRHKEARVWMYKHGCENSISVFISKCKPKYIRELGYYSCDSGTWKIDEHISIFEARIIDVFKKKLKDVEGNWLVDVTYHARKLQKETQERIKQRRKNRKKYLI